MDHILVGVNYTETDEVIEHPGSTLELLGAVRPPNDEARGAEWMASLEGSGGKLRV